MHPGGRSVSSGAELRLGNTKLCVKDGDASVVELHEGDSEVYSDVLVVSDIAESHRGMRQHCQ